MFLGRISPKTPPGIRKSKNYQNEKDSTKEV